MAETISLYETIGRNIGDVRVKGSPTNCIASTLESNAFIHPLAGQLKGKDIFIFTGVGAGQARTIIDFVPGSNYVVVEPIFSTVPTANSTFLVFDNFLSEDYENAMNRAMAQVKLRHLEEVVATNALVATQYEYAVPSGFEYINTLRFVPSSNSDYAEVDDINTIFELPSRFWRIEGNQGGSRLIVIDPRKVNLDSFDKMIIKIEGQQKPDFVATTIPANVEEYIIAFASMQLSAQKVGREWERRFFMFRDLVKGDAGSPGLEEYICRYGRGKKVN